MSDNSVKLHRVLRTTPEKLYRAFLEPEAFARWLPPNGFTARVYEMTPEEGGTFRMSFTNFTTGNGHSFSGTYLELKPHSRICYTTKFDDPGLSGEMKNTIDIQQVSCGTEIRILQEEIPEVIPTAGCYLGWQESLCHLARLVEPEIPE